MFDQAVGCAFLVEDCDHDVAIFEYAARRMQFPITLRKHSSGASALSEIDTFNQLADAQLPALFILDIAMPDIDGLTVCKRIIEQYRARGAGAPKIVFLTSQPTQAVIEYALRSAMIEIHQKPSRLSDYEQIFQAMFDLATDTAPSSQLSCAAG